MQIQKQHNRRRDLRFTSVGRYLRGGEVNRSTRAIHITTLLQITRDTTDGKLETSLDRHGKSILPPAHLSGFAAVVTSSEPNRFLTRVLNLRCVTDSAAGNTVIIAAVSIVSVSIA
ncbi:hypothetical protein F2Q70_00020086 [Brassica cretica]|uniref:Uncharacterized protein n=1 Tax=Brassica cretica TaxID=69181 RepID=A0A8S9HAQ2_BRACR|nr:hypothetical protein F2Q70_00020086 [Brassica cretica]KAF2555153.1 hypothetical protein F2Q68_00013572 [Brassica cretica]